MINKIANFSILIVLLWGMLSACKVQQAKTKPATVFILPDAPEVKVVYPCTFETGTFEGVLPCFGDDCGAEGAPLTSLQFEQEGIVHKQLEWENGLKSSLKGTWKIMDDCIITLQFTPDKQEYFKYHKDIQKIEMLNSEQGSYSGALNKHYIISKIK